MLRAQAEKRYRDAVRLVRVASCLYVPTVLLVGIGLGKVFNSNIPFYVFGGTYTAALLVMSVRVFTAYYGLTGRYPYYFLFSRSRQHGKQ